MKTISLGVTGHRFLADQEKIQLGVEQVVACLLESYPSCKFRVLSSLAEGTDRLLARRLLELPRSVLWVPLPLPEEEYLKDFETSQSKDEFIQLLEKAERLIQMPVTKTREEGYLAAGDFVLENSDCLLTIWDGKPAQGMGGTAGIIALARERGLPLAWIHAGNRIPATNIPTSLGPDQGKVTFEHFPPPGRKP